MFNGRNFKYNSLVFSSKILLFTGLVAIIVATVISLSIFAYQRRLIIKDHQLEIQFAAENLSKSLSVAMKIKNYPEISRISSQSHLLNRSISLYFTDENDEFLIGITESQILDKIPICSFNKGNINVFFDQIFTGKIYYCYKLNLGNQMPVVTLILVTLALSVFLIILLLFWFRIQTSDIQAVVDYLDMVDPNYPNQVKFRKEITSPIKSVVRKIEVILDKINNQNQEIIKIEKDRLVGVLAKQLSHDIRSPLAALKVVKELGAGGMDPEVGKLLSSSIDRITDIANTILPKKSETTGEDVKNEAEPSFVWMLIDQIISEKRVEYKNIDGVSIQFRVDGSPFKLNAFCHPPELMRAISNTINNSIEARNQHLPIRIDIALQSTQDQIRLFIMDNGRGMAPEILARVFDDGFTHGKEKGTGLGLYQVKKAVESWGGKVQIESQVGVGTQITLELKKSKSPDWLIQSIDVSKYQSIVVLDDEEYVFSILKDKFDVYKKPVRYFKRIDDFERECITMNNVFFFVDHDLKQKLNGIELIEKNNIQNRSVLLTGNYDDKTIQQKSTQSNIKILPKPLIHDIDVGA